MKFSFLTTFLLFISSVALFAQEQKPNQKQFILIIRSKSDVKVSKEKISANIMHWQEYMVDLGKHGKIAGGYRPSSEGETIYSPDKVVRKKPYIANGELVSSFLIINAADLSEAREIASKCPVYDLGGNVELRPIQQTANYSIVSAL